MLPTSPKHILDFILWPILKLLWEPFSIKQSHFWHWMNYSNAVQYKTLIPTDPQAIPRNSLWKLFIYTNISWEKCVILKPKNFNTNTRYQVGFINGRENKKQLCSIILNTEVAVLCGPYPTHFFAIDYNAKQVIELEILKETKKNILEQNIPLI
jgi:hypothetical protein